MIWGLIIWLQVKVSIPITNKSESIFDKHLLFTWCLKYTTFTVYYNTSDFKEIISIENHTGELFEMLIKIFKYFDLIKKIWSSHSYLLYIPSCKTKRSVVFWLGDMNWQNSFYSHSSISINKIIGFVFINEFTEVASQHELTWLEALGSSETEAGMSKGAGHEAPSESCVWGELDGSCGSAADGTGCAAPSPLILAASETEGITLLLKLSSCKSTTI